MLLGKRRYGYPIIINKGGSISRPKRIPLTQKLFEEGWIQEHIREHPELLPINDIEPVFAPLISIGREVPTLSGSIDNLFLSNQGYLTIVETKLWRNPEARREVVGQIIDYAKDVSQWAYDDLEKLVREYNKKYRQKDIGILDTLRLYEQIDDQDEPELIDSVSKNIKNGRFLLLIVGDGIRESVEEMAQYLQRTPQLFFTLALVELQVYEVEDDDSLLVIPQVVTRTTEVVRAVVRVETHELGKFEVSVPDEKVGKEKPKRFTLTEDEFFKHLEGEVGPAEVKIAHQIINDMEKIGCIIDWKQASFVVKLPDPTESGQNLTMFVIQKNGVMWLGWLPTQLKNINLPMELGQDFVAKLADLFKCKVASTDKSILSRNIPLKELYSNYSEFLVIVKAAVSRIKEASLDI